MRDRHDTQWERLGEVDPYWAVLTDASRKGNAWDQDVFFETGAVDVAGLFQEFVQLELDPPRNVALDFGCGVGRLSRALATRFEQVVAVDVSTSMLAEARRANARYTNINWVHNTRRDLRAVADGCVDLVYSNIVLQHMPGGRQIGFIGEFCRILAPNGVAVFQTPSHFKSQRWRRLMNNQPSRYVRHLLRSARHGKDTDMEVYPLHRTRVERVLSDNGLVLRRVEDYGVVSPLFASYRYYATHAASLRGATAAAVQRSGSR